MTLCIAEMIKRECRKGKSKREAKRRYDSPAVSRSQQNELSKKVKGSDGFQKIEQAAKKSRKPGRKLKFHSRPIDKNVDFRWLLANRKRPTAPACRSAS
jgi:hypothetical protein